MRYGLVMEGGSLRGMFTAGVTDVLMENNIEFDGGIGVSAGAAFGCNYKSRQIGRAIKYNLDLCKDWRYASFRSWLLTGDVFGAKFCYRTVPEQLYPFDSDTYKANPMKFYAVCTDIITGKPIYHECPQIDDSTLEWFRASASMPLVSRIVKVDGYTLLDGGMSDSIPLKAFEDMGYERNIVILTQPKGYIKKRNPLMPIMNLIYRRYPKLLECMENRHLVYNEQTAYVDRREREGFCLALYPENPLPVHHIDHNRDHINKTYEMGREVGIKNLDKIKSFLAK